MSYFLFIFLLKYCIFLLLLFKHTSMDEQESMFYFEEFNDGQSIPSQNFKSQHYLMQMAEEPPKQSLTLKAFNPYQYAENLPAKDQQQFVSMMMNNKKYAGLTHFINFDKTQEMPEFFSEFKGEDYVNKDWIENPLHLQNLFENIDPQTLKKRLIDVQQQINKLTKQAFKQININHIIIHSFNENFENYIYLNSHINFIKDLEIKMINFTDHIKDQEYGYELIVKIFEFWMKTFQDFVLSIKKHTSRYTLSMAKKMKDSQSSNQQGKSTSSSRILQAQKRRSWKPSQLQRLQKLITSNSAYNQALINKLSQELNRTPASISSKIQKLIKDHKAHNPDYEIHENMTLFEKVVNVMKNYPNGLSKQSVIERVNQHYEMGFDLNWSKSVGQILSSRPQFVRIKGTYSLNGKHKFDMNKKTFKDKVINCLVTIPEGKACLKRIVDQYISLYGTSEGISILSEERRKTIEASISKSMSRYDIFNKQNSKTIYKLRQFCDEKDIDEEIVGYIS